MRRTQPRTWLPPAAPPPPPPGEIPAVADPLQLSFAVSDGAAQRAARTSQLTFDPNEMYIKRSSTAPPTGGHGYAAASKPALRPLDPIDPGLVGRVDYTSVFKTTQLAATTGIRWAERLESYLKDGFPRANGLVSEEPRSTKVRTGLHRTRGQGRGDAARAPAGRHHQTCGFFSQGHPS
jgi:hypothetical protein